MATRTRKSPTAHKLPKGSHGLPASVATRKGAKGTVEKAEVRIFVSYSHADAGARHKLQTHLAALMRDSVSTWFDGDMNAGDALDLSVSRALRRAHIFVALLSPEYLASSYCWNIEYRRAMNRRARGTMRVIAAIVRPCDWKETRAVGFKLLPRDGRPVTRWRSADEAYLNIAEGIRGVVRTLRKEMAVKTVKPLPPTTAEQRKTRKASPERAPGISKGAELASRPKRSKAKP